MTSAQTIGVLLTRNLLEVFGERDPAKRKAVISEIFSDDSVFFDPDGEYVGRDSIEKVVTALQAKFPDFVFRTVGAPQALGNAGRLAWGFGPENEPPRVTGTDVILVRGDRIAALYAFLDPPTA